MYFTCVVKFSSQSKMESRTMEHWTRAELAPMEENHNLNIGFVFPKILFMRRGVVTAPTLLGDLPAALTPKPFLGIGTSRRGYLGG